MRKFKIEDVKEFVINNSECELLSTIYINNKTKLLFKCKCGETFETTFERFKLGKIKCDFCSGIKTRKRICKYCKKSFIPDKKNQIYCSRKCSANDRKKDKIKVKCYNCGTELERVQYAINRNKKHYCSIKCKNEHQKQLLKGKDNPNYKEKSFISKCSNCGTEYIANNYGNREYKYHYCSIKCKWEHQKKILTGKQNPNYKSVKCNCSYCNKEINRTQNYINSHKNIFCSKECYYNYLSKYNCGKNNPLFDITKTKEEREIGRNFDGYKYWRREVFKRDSYTCQCCGDNKGGNLRSHHLDGYSWCKEKRIDIDNGITLCDKCHKGFHDEYGYNNNTKEQFEKYIEKFKNT